VGASASDDALWRMKLGANRVERVQLEADAGKFRPDKHARNI
jgi:hypothetical protein